MNAALTTMGFLPHRGAGYQTDMQHARSSLPAGGRSIPKICVMTGAVHFFEAMSVIKNGFR